MQGCSANKAATAALRQAAPVMRWSSRNSSTVLAMWSSRLVQ